MISVLLVSKTLPHLLLVEKKKKRSLRLKLMPLVEPVSGWFGSSNKLQCFDYVMTTTKVIIAIIDV